MEFYILENDRPYTTTKPVIFLVPDNWNDWFEFRTLFGMYYATSENVEWIGSVKIGQKGLMQKPDSVEYISPDLPKSFNNLIHDFFSIGQDVSYYTNLNKLGEDLRVEILKGLNDIALNDEIYKDVKNEYVLSRSLLRDVSRVSVKGQYRRLANGNAKLSEYYFEYELPDNNLDSTLTLHVVPHQMPPMNIHVLIGRNGVGKTNLIRNLVNYGMTDDLSYGNIYTDVEEELFAGILLVSFSSFENENVYSVDNITGLKFDRIGLVKNEGDKYLPKTFDDLVKDFQLSLYGIKSSGKSSRWKRTIEMLNSDPIFDSIGIEELIEDHSIDKAELVFQKLSSGHKIVLLTITQLVEKVEERTLVILDEPELHLHPPLLSAFTRALSELLITRNAVALIATHSPVIVQEVPSECVKIMNRNNNYVDFESPNIETFGENIGTLTREIFGLEVRESGFHRILTEFVKKGFSYDEILEELDGKIGLEAKTLIRSMLFSKGGNRDA
ncbi:ATP-dependent endonuclease [Lysinibacillus sp. NPDC059133]|uniref:ATP-dependent nuclease n=1 Tax=Lysinibacillus sp. NPDC059133 TaxID=3346737 RepID=UPI0036C47AEB